MKYTSAEANKMLKKLGEEKESLISMENASSTFKASLGEDPETLRPEYDYSSVQKELEEIERRVREVKHAINLFNVKTVLPNSKITIDQALILMPQLKEQKHKLFEMKNRMKKERAKGLDYMRSSIIDYIYVNYDLNQVKKDYDAVSEKLASLQLELDTVNSTKTFEINI